MNKSLFFGACATLLTSTLTKAAIIVTAPEGGATVGSISITAPITFDIDNDATEGILLVLDHWVKSDDSIGYFAPGSEGITIDYSLDGGDTTQSATFNYMIDNYVNNEGDIKPNDGLMVFTSPSFSVSNGDQLTLFAKTWSVQPLETVNPEAYQTYTGNVFLVSNSNNERISNIVSVVPEPDTFAALCGLSALGLVLAGRRHLIRS